MIIFAKFLHNDEWYVIKRIEFSYKRGFASDWYNAEIYYARRCTEKYLLPTFKYTPHDALDELILESIKKKFEDIKIKTESQLLDLEQKENRKSFCKQGGRDISLNAYINITPVNSSIPHKVDVQELKINLAITTFPEEVDLDELCLRTYRTQSEIKQLETLCKETFVCYKDAIALIDDMEEKSSE